MSRDEERGWRVGHQGRDRMYYEELRDGAWQRLDIDGEMLTGRAHHEIHFASPARWQQYPAWARARRAEIIARIKSEFRAPDYEYLEGCDAVATHAAANSSAAGASRRPATRPAKVPTSAQGKRAVTVALSLLLALAIAMGWLVVRGLSHGETWFPSKRASQQRVVTRAQEPVTFWLALGLYSAFGLGALGLSAWGIHAARPHRNGDSRNGDRGS